MAGVFMGCLLWLKPFFAGFFSSCLLVPQRQTHFSPSGGAKKMGEESRPNMPRHVLSTTSRSSFPPARPGMQLLELRWLVFSWAACFG